jgi:hypothetical protein
MVSSIRSISLRRSASVGVVVWVGFVIAGDSTRQAGRCQAAVGVAGEALRRAN